MDFAHEYWEEFEKLSIDILKAHFKYFDDTQISIKKTKSKKDGGFDGIIVISTGQNQLHYKILSESKLRAVSSKDLPLSDFSKTLVIAINLFAQEVYIFTNLHFSKETQRRIANFTKATNINVKLMDIFHVTDNINKLSRETIANYSPSLISELMNSICKHQQSRKTNFEDIISFSAPEKYIGTKMEELLKNARSLLDGNTGILIVSGGQGTGKSLFIQHLTYLLQKKETGICSYIDMVKFSNINDFFISLLSIIWQIDILDIASFNQDDIDEITSYIVDEDMSKEAKQVLFDVIISGAESFFTSKDLMHNCLMEYLYKIYSPILKARKQVLIFHNIDYATNYAKEILLMFLKRFYKENIIIILEIRNELPSTRSYLKRCTIEIPIIDEIELSDFRKKEAVKYLYQKYSKDFSKKELGYLKKICPRTPLLIDQVVQIFSSNDLMRNLLDESLETVGKLLKNPKYIKNINNNYVKRVMCEYEDEIKICAACIAFMDGELDLSCIGILCTNPSHIVCKLIETHIFKIENTTIEVYHVSILNPLKEMGYIQDILIRQKVYLQLYNVIDSFDILPQKRAIKKIFLAIKLNELEYVSDNWKSVCSNLINENDYEIALELLKEIEDTLYNDLDFSNMFCVQSWILQCYLAENMYKQEEIETCIEELEEIISNTENGVSKTEREKYIALKSKYFLAIGKYDELISDINHFDDITAQLYYIRALGIKHVYGIDMCIKSLEEGIIAFPNDKYIQYAYYDHLLSKAFKYDLSLSKKYISKMKSYIDILSLEDRIHYRYNDQIALFYNDELDNLNELMALMRVSFQNNLPVEQSRICNLIGQFYWVRNNIDLAIEYFEKASELQLYTNHQSYWWISETNLALIYYELHDEAKSIDAINIVLNIYIANGWTKIKTFFSMDALSEEKIVLDKEIVSFLLLLSLMYKIDPTAVDAFINNLCIDHKISPQVIWFSKKYLISVFEPNIKKTSYYFKNHYMIKG